MIQRDSATHIARGVLVVLVFIHLILPFTPANHHPELHIKIASILFGFGFLAFTALSFEKPRAAFRGGLIFLLALYLVSAATGASPITEGILPKFIFATGLILGIHTNPQSPKR
ncbi:hypothetical protein [Pelagicoccus mobilis]|uniref:Uncharacterized protein n=1 Tax=Pelagicoccus mobilis TaxID=415221 RepID=A0A934RY05_9BACT|nr:hypothetical protein [Pelagicoccus mobilis]MBK1877319.1 hypothetical protein [Pelagicoccus mobilis]